jgi:hypothetical protein
MGASWQLTPQNVQCINSIHSFELAVLSVKVGWQVVIEIHVNDHTEKLADTRQDCSSVA